MWWSSFKLIASTEAGTTAEEETAKQSTTWEFAQAGTQFTNGLTKSTVIAVYKTLAT